MTCGEIVLYTKDMRPLLLSASEGASEFQVEELKIKGGKDGKIRELLESVLYFGVMKNHVVVAQSSALRSRDLENYLNWFLGDKASVMGGDNLLALGDCPSSETKKKIEKSHVKSVAVGAPLEVGVPSDGAGAVGNEVKGVEGGVKTLKYVPVGRGFSILRAALGEQWFEEFKLSDALDESNLQVKLEVTYLRKTSENAHRMLDNIALSTRHMEPEDTTIYLHGGGRISGEEIKMFSRENIRAINGRVDREDVFGKMVAFLQSRLAGGIIDS